MKIVKLTFFIIVTAAALQSHAQFADIDVEISPLNPTDKDSMMLTLKILTVAESYVLQKPMQINGNHIEIDVCLQVTALGHPSLHLDTFSLGKLSNGTYNYHINIYQVYSNCNIPIDSMAVSDSFNVKSTVSLQEYQLLQKLRIYPNPAQDYLDVENLKDIKINEIRIFDITGKLAREVAVTEFKKLRIDLSGLNRGSYFLKLKTNEGEASKQFVVE